MKVILSPQVSNKDDVPPTVNVDVISYRGTDYDLSQIPDGGEVEAESPFVGKIKRVNGEIQITLQYQYSTDTAEPHQSRDIADYTFTVTSGQCPCPIKRKEQKA